SVTCARDTSVMSSLCFAMSESRRSNGPEKFSSVTAKGVRPACGAAPSGASEDGAGAASGDVTAGDELTGQPPVGLGPGVGGRVARDRLGGDRRVRELDRPVDHGVEDPVPEPLADAFEDLARVERAAVVHRHEDAVELEP